MTFWDILKGKRRALKEMAKEVLQDTPNKLITIEEKMDSMSQKIDIIIREGRVKTDVPAEE
tara:strand:+ start:650 stop:832 length:183 start_codon:yes stop_codon:yes gene_type:complete